MTAVKGNRWGHRDATMVLVGYRHGLRAAELVDLRWDQVDFKTATLHVRRVKQGTPSAHPILGDELRALRRLQREQEPRSPFVFTSERGAPFTTAGFARMIERAGVGAKLGFKAHPFVRRFVIECPAGWVNNPRFPDWSVDSRLLSYSLVKRVPPYLKVRTDPILTFWRSCFL